MHVLIWDLFPLYLFNYPQTLQRASSVPTRTNVPELPVTLQPSRHENTQSQEQSIETPIEVPPLTPSTTEESVAPISSMEPLLSVTAGNTNTAANIKFEVNGQRSIPNLPGVIPLQGHLHQQGWL